MIKRLVLAYFYIGSFLGLGTCLSYVMMPWKLAYDGCYGLIGFLTASVWGLAFGFIGYLSKLVMWPYGLYVTYTYDLGYMKWVFPGVFAGCAQ
jgi:hypothetical protein